MRDWIRIGLRKDIVFASLRLAAVVGTALLLINYGDKIIANTISSTDLLKIALSYSVPYLVSTYSSIRTIQNQK